MIATNNIKQTVNAKTASLSVSSSSSFMRRRATSCVSQGYDSIKTQRTLTLRGISRASETRENTQVNELLINKENDKENESTVINHWENFYKMHSKQSTKSIVTAFRDRHYLRNSWHSDLMGKRVSSRDSSLSNTYDPNGPFLTVLEFGCGVGNAIFPLLRANKNMTAVCCDVSSTAIESLRANEEFSDERITKTFVVDAGEANSLNGIEDGTFDAVTMVFFLSALDDYEIKNALDEVYRVLKPNGGVALVRDYATKDIKNSSTSLEFAPGEKIINSNITDDTNNNTNNAYRRGDGTLARFFSEEQMSRMFTDTGFKNESSEVKRVEFTQTNRKLNIDITRSFLEGRFVK